MTIGRVMAIDLGTKRIGVAISDALRMAANPLAVLPDKSEDENLSALDALAREHEIVEIVVGLPLHMDGTESHGSMYARLFAKKLAARTGLPVHLRDERLTSVAAEDFLLQQGVRGAKRKARVDREAAAFILQGYLDEGASS